MMDNSPLVVHDNKKEDTTTFSQRILSFDVGTRHLSYADLEIFTALDSNGKNTKNEHIPNTSIVVRGWRVVDLFSLFEDDDARQHNGREKKIMHKRHFDIGDTSERLITVLRDSFSDDTSCYDHVLVENQPSLKNPSMKSISMIIYTFFQTIKMLFGSVGSVQFVSALAKLSTKTHLAVDLVDSNSMNKEEDERENIRQQGVSRNRSKSISYEQKKKLAVEKCRRVLKRGMVTTRLPPPNPNFNTDDDKNDHDAASLLEFFETSKKKDDLADAFLQALAFYSDRIARIHLSTRAYF
jgi:hypothetical protein